MNHLGMPSESPRAPMRSSNGRIPTYRKEHNVVLGTVFSHEWENYWGFEAQSEECAYLADDALHIDDARPHGGGHQCLSMSVRGSLLCGEEYSLK
jgi:hypothetical protein